MEWCEKSQTFPVIHGARQVAKHNVNTHVYNLVFHHDFYMNAVNVNEVFKCKAGRKTSIRFIQ